MVNIMKLKTDIIVKEEKQEVEIVMHQKRTCKGKVSDIIILNQLYL